MNIHINVKNFGPIEKAEIDLRPLTVFVGESNTGKTYLAALIYALHQHFEGFSQLPWANSAASFLGLVYGPRRRFSPSLQDKVEQEKLEMLEKLNTPGRPFKLSDLPQQMHAQIESRLENQEDFTNELKRCFDLESASKLIRFIGNQDNKLKVSLSVGDHDKTYWNFEARVSV